MTQEQIVRVVVNERQLAEVEALLKDIPRGFNRALSRALNKVGVSARVLVLRMITRELALKQKDLRSSAGWLHRGDSVRLHRASLYRLFVTLDVVGGRIPLMAFGARQTARGVTYRVRRAGGRQRIADAFIATMGSGRTGVFRRVGEPKGGGGRPRLPIHELRGPSVPEVVITAQQFTSGTLHRIIGEKLERELAAQTELLLQRRAREGVGVAPF